MRLEKTAVFDDFYYSMFFPHRSYPKNLLFHLCDVHVPVLLTYINGAETCPSLTQRISSSERQDLMFIKISVAEAAETVKM